MTISSKFGDKLFEGFSNIPFAFILITDSVEYLINHPNPSPDFTLLGYDDILKTNIFYRSTIYNKHFLATFPAVNGLSCIVAGTPENTNTNSSAWVITMLHEHFHQYQNAYHDYFISVNELDLSGGDQTGMWMLNYPFPYDSLPVTNQYKAYTEALYNTVLNRNNKTYNSYLKQYLIEREKFKQVLKPADYRYFSFQIWQEGLARFTEYNFLQLLKNYKPSKEMAALPDFVSFEKIKTAMYQTETENLIKNELKQTQRVSFYSVGFAEGIVLDKSNKRWRKNYMADKFFIEHYFKKYNF